MTTSILSDAFGTMLGNDRIIEVCESLNKEQLSNRLRQYGRSGPPPLVARRWYLGSHGGGAVKGDRRGRDERRRAAGGAAPDRGGMGISPPT